MSDVVAVKIENLSNRTPRKYKINFAVAVLTILALQFLLPVWKLHYEDPASSGDSRTLERPLSECLFSRSPVFKAPIVVPGQIPATAKNPDINNLKAVIDWKSTITCILASLIYSSIGIYGVIGGRPDKALRHKRLMQLITVSTAIFAGIAGLVIIASMKPAINPQTLWHPVQAAFTYPAK